MKFQKLVLTGLVALTATATAQSAAFSAQLDHATQLTSDDVASISIRMPRNTHRSTSAPKVTQFRNPTHPTSDEVGAVQNNSSELRKANRTSHVGRNLNTIHSFMNPTHPTASEIGRITAK